MNIDHLRYFLVLTQEMHYGRAAQRLNISQSGLSHAMAALEQELGAPLFQKSGRGIALGRYGAALLPPGPADRDPGGQLSAQLPNAPGGHRHPPHPNHSSASRPPGHPPVPPVQSSAPRL